MSIPEGALIVKYRDLIPDGHNIVDRTFRADVERFMERFMPGGPMGLLSTNYERWEIQPDQDHAVRRVEVSVEPDEEEAEAGETPTKEMYAIENTRTCEWVTSDHDYARHIDSDEQVRLGDDADVLVWEWEDEAEEQIEQLDSAYDSEHGHENRLAIPWGHSWWRNPDDIISDEDLKRAGWTVATYTGGEGDVNGEQFRLAGIDMVGSSHEPHWAHLYAICAERREWPVKTDRGDAYITFDYRTELEKLAGETREGS